MKLKFNRDGWTDWMVPLSPKCPVGVGWYVKVECEDLTQKEVYEGMVTPSNINNPQWKYLKRYKVRKPLGASKLEEMLKDLPKVVDKELEST